MTRLGIVGGKLQGMEAAYLARKAGLETIVFDRNPSAPALALADEAMVIDVVKESDKAARSFADCDAVLPANENYETLVAITKTFGKLEVPLIFDMNAYIVSSSKSKSNEFMQRLEVPLPRPWPDCGFPVVVKPSTESGSIGVTRATNADELKAGKDRVSRMGDEAIVQEFVDGPSISVEVLSDGIDVVPLITTQIFLDGVYDCKMVGSPWENGDEGVEEVLAEAGRRMALELGLHGIMDVEAIVSNGAPRVLEIDARIPSQTPAAVLHSHGINMVDMLVDMSINNGIRKPKVGRSIQAYYEHIAVDDGTMRSCGEGGFAEVKRPKIMPGLFGSDEMITDYEPGKKSWRATIINTGGTVRSARIKRQKVLQAIMDREGIHKYIDSEPEGYT